MFVTTDNASPLPGATPGSGSTYWRISMRRQHDTRRLDKLIRPYGLRVVEGAHRKIVDAHGKAVYSFSGSPSCAYFAENTLAALVKMGLVPRALKGQKIR